MREKGRSGRRVARGWFGAESARCSSASALILCEGKSARSTRTFVSGDVARVRNHVSIATRSRSNGHPARSLGLGRARHSGGLELVILVGTGSKSGVHLRPHSRRQRPSEGTASPCRPSQHAPCSRALRLLRRFPGKSAAAWTGLADTQCLRRVFLRTFVDLGAAVRSRRTGSGRSVRRRTAAYGFQIG